MKFLQWLFWVMLIVQTLPFSLAQEKQTEYVKEEKASSFNREAEAQKHYRRGEIQFDEGYFKSAITSLDRAVLLKPTYTKAFYLRAQCKDAINLYNEAINDYEIVLRQKPDFSEALFSKAVLNFQEERFANAISDFNQLLSMPFLETNTIFFKDFNVTNNASESTVSEISSLNSPSFIAEIQNYLGLSYFGLKDYQEALFHFDSAIALKNYSPDFYVNRGLVYMESDQKSEAVLDFEQALKLESDHSQALYNLAILSESEGLAAVQAFSHAVKANHKIPEAYVSRGYAYFQSGNYASAISDYDSAILLGDKEASTFMNRGLAHEKLKHYKLALKDFQKVLELDSGWGKGYLNMGNIYFKIKDYQAAVTSYNMAELYDRRNSILYYNRALANYKINAKENACNDLQQALKLGFSDAQKAINAYCR